MATSAVYLPDGEPFSPRRGGALATWTHEVYRRLAREIDAVVIANKDVSPYGSLCVEPCAPNLFGVWLGRVIRDRRLRGALEPGKRFLRRAHARRAGRICQRIAPAIIHIHNDPEAVIPIRRRNPSATIVLHMNNEHLIEGEGALAAPETVQAADWVAFCSSYLMTGALNKIESLSSERCFVIYNGAQLLPEPRLPAEGFKSKTPVILFVGRIVPQKGLHVLLDALPEVWKRFPSARLRIIGGVRFGCDQIDGYLAGLHEKAAALGGGIEFAGPAPHDEVGNHFQKADVFVCPSVWNEPLGMVNLEAMAAGVPVVAFAKGGIPEAVGQAGLLVEETEPEALSGALIRLLSESALRRELAVKGRERVARHFAWEVLAEQWHQRLSRWSGAEQRSKIGLHGPCLAQAPQ